MKEVAPTALIGVVVAVVRSALRVRLLDNGHTVYARLSGKLMVNHIRCVVNDKVLIELSPYDLTKGRVIRRY